MIPPSAAVISPCGRYRYSLERHYDEDGPAICWLMLNPSTADAMQDDPTIRKVKGFSTRHGYGAAMVVNLFAWRATKPKDVLLNLADADGGHDNMAAVLQAATLSDVVVCAWGATPWAREQARRVVGWLNDLADSFAIPKLVCLGTNQDGSPRHPLMVPYSQPLVPFVVKP